MSKLALLGIVFFIFCAGLFVFTLLSVDKLDRYFESIRQHELAEKHQAIGVFANAALSSGTILERTMLDEHVVGQNELKPSSIRSVQQALDRLLLRSVAPGHMLMDEDLGPVPKETK
jgi:hypothetical protein